MDNQENSPRISSLSWGRIETEDGETYKDAKLYPGGSREWDWNETGTDHVPGIQPADVEELIENGSEVVILSKGINKRLQTMDRTRKMLEEKNIDYHILQSEKAVEKYNQLSGKKKVGALIHSTC